jgi:vanillate O-demethylase monooxygenase subunit
MKTSDICMTPGAAEFPLDQWYVAAWSHEIEPGRMVARDVCGEPLMFYRSSEGAVRALFNRCPHRGMPLTAATSRVEGDGVRCGYHGIRFDERGKAIEVPSGGVVPSKMAVRAFPVVEQWAWIWVWMGDPSRCDPSRIPDHAALGIGAQGMFSEPGIHLEVKANYLLPLENLLDATHITYLHHGLIDSGNVARHPYTLEQHGTTVSTVRRFENDTLPPMLCAAMGLRGDRVDRTLTLTAHANHLCEIRQDFVEVGQPDATPGCINLIVSITPGQARLTHHFALFATSFENRHPGRFDDLRRLLMEDVVVIEQIQALYDRLGEQRAPEVSVKSDEANTRSRRLIAEMIRSERAAAASARVAA